MIHPRHRRKSIGSDTGSMADIAFLLLIFFFVTTTIAPEYGIKRDLPKWSENHQPDPIPERNVFTILLNEQGDIMARGQEMTLSDLPRTIAEFMLNEKFEETGPTLLVVRPDEDGFEPYYRLADETIVFLKFHPNVSYDAYIDVQEAIRSGYSTIWDNVTRMAVGRDFNSLDKKDLDDRALIKLAREAFPMKIAEQPIK